MSPIRHPRNLAEDLGAVLGSVESASFGLRQRPQPRPRSIPAGTGCAPTKYDLAMVESLLRAPGSKK
jgi:hypothetical protein